MRAAILVQHHAGHRCGLARPPVRTAPLGALHRALQRELEPRVAARAAVFAIPGAKMPHIPPGMPAAVALYERHRLVSRCAQWTDPFEPSIEQAVHSGFLVALPRSAETSACIS